MHRRALPVLLGAAVAVCTGVLGMNPTSQASSVAPQIRVRFISLSGVSLRALSHGAVGRGALLYYQGSTPKLLVLLSHQARSVARAVVYDNVETATKAEIEDGQTIGTKVIAMQALGGWWVRNGIANYNLVVKLFGPMYGMWGEPTYQGQLRAGELWAVIRTQANRRGVPQWDFRQLVPAFPGEGVLRANYAQRTGPGPLRFVPSVSPLWPYVAYSGYFTQPNGEFVPPIVVDWKTGRVTMFSEIVSVRSENSSYDFYSLTPVRIGQKNTPDFETPWALYDLSGKGQGYPDLLIRTEHYYADDPYSDGVSARLLGSPGIPKANEDIRYSWADHPGNDLFNYKIDVFGFHPYPGYVPIMNGHTYIKAPSHRAYPHWIIDHRWPLATFVDTNGGGYQTSEGIYDWASRVSPGYWLGQTTRPNLSEFQTIRTGFRGEYRIGLAHRPRLYISPVDRRLHLLYAQGGLWNLGAGWMVKEGNLTGGPYIDEWNLLKQQGHRSDVRGRLLVVGNVGISSTANGTVRIATLKDPSPEIDILDPPTSHRTWMTFRSTVHRLATGRNPYKLGDWLAAIPGHHLTLQDAAISALHEQNGVLRFTLAVNSKRVQGSLTGLSLPKQSGQYAVRYNIQKQTWSILRASPPVIHGTVIVGRRLQTLKPERIRVGAANSGISDQETTLRLWDGSRLIWHTRAWIDGGSILKFAVDVHLPPGPSVLRLSAGTNTLATDTVKVSKTPRGSPVHLWMLSIPGSGRRIYVPLSAMLAAGLVAAGFAVWRRVTVV